MTHPKRLIEVDLPIKRISAHARREKSIRHGHISTLHIWWARRPLAACRAVICASLWPDPADPNCPQVFRDAALTQMLAFAKATQSDTKLSDICDDESWKRYMKLANGMEVNAESVEGRMTLRAYLLDFIADFAAWEASTNHWFLDTARALTQSAHEALGGEKGTRPLVVDPFAGGGAIPLEALRVGADAFASDLNPVAVLLNKVVLEYIPKYGQKLADEVRKWGQWIKEQAEKELGQFYPKDADGATPIAYLWARTIQCEGPSCGAEVPLIRSMWLAKKSGRSVALRMTPDAKRRKVDFEIVHNGNSDESEIGTVRRGSATCPCCGYTTPVQSVRLQLATRNGGARDARLLAVVTTCVAEQGRTYRLPRQADFDAVSAAQKRCSKLSADPSSGFSIPTEAIALTELRRISVPIYGMDKWCDIYTPRQLLSLGTLSRLVRNLIDSKTATHSIAAPMSVAIASCLAILVDRQVDATSSLSRWHTTRELITGMFGRQALGMVWDFAEVNPFGEASGSLSGALDWIVKVCELNAAAGLHAGTARRDDAAHHQLPDDSADAVITDPPYYDAVPYAHLADCFYVWMKRSLGTAHPELFNSDLIEKQREIVVDRPHSRSNSIKTLAFYEDGLLRAFSESRRLAKPQSVSVIVFASKTTASWEAVLQAIVQAGWMIVGSWPIDTEMEARVSAQGQARLASSVHIVCRPREGEAGATSVSDAGDWRDILAELPKVTREWMGRLSQEGVVGADAIFACLGPALEIFSRYSRVEKANGEQVLLKEYLTYVWGAVAQEALAQIFKDADTTGFEEDARLTAMWLWTLNAGAANLEQTGDAGDSEADDSPDEGEDEKSSVKGKPSGYILEFDAARKIAQGLGAHLEQMTDVVEVKGDKARLLSVGERTRKLFGKDDADVPKAKPKKKDKQLRLGFAQELEAAEAQGGWGDKSVPKLGDTTLDRIHQSMILFAAGRGEAMRRFLVEDGAGRDQRFWKLANALSALYPQGTDEKRWVDGVLARKKGLGL